MARNRMIRPEFWEDTKIASLSTYSRLFFIALWNFADDEGYIENDHLWLKAKCFPYDKVSIKELVDELLNSGRIKVNNEVIKIINFSKYQRIDRPKKSDLKDRFDEHSTNTQRTFDEHSTTKEKLREVKLREGAGAPTAEEFINSLRTNTAYKHINIDAELFKMDAWLLAHNGRQKTKRFIVNWLNKIEAPIGIVHKTKPKPENIPKIDPDQHAKVAALIKETANKMGGI